MSRTVLLVILLAGLVFAGANLIDLAPGQSPQPVEAPAGSDYYLLGAEVEQLTADGSLSYRLTADESLHYPDGSTQLKNIHVDYPDHNQAPWRLDADSGEIPAGGRDIRLSGDVLAQRDSRQHGALRIRTPHVWVRPDANRVDTDAPVEADQPGRRASGVGMTINLENDRLSLHNNVQVTYAP